jgi:hypothetical protein
MVCNHHAASISLSWLDLISRFLIPGPDFADDLQLQVLHIDGNRRIARRIHHLLSQGTRKSHRICFACLSEEEKNMLIMSGLEWAGVQGCFYVLASFQDYFRACWETEGASKVILLLVEAIGMYEIHVLEEIFVPVLEEILCLFRKRPLLMRSKECNFLLMRGKQCKFLLMRGKECKPGICNGVRDT